MLEGAGQPAPFYLTGPKPHETTAPQQTQIRETLPPQRGANESNQPPLNRNARRIPTVKYLEEKLYQLLRWLHHKLNDIPE